MVKLRFHAAGGAKLCEIEATPQGEVIERNGNAPRATGRKPQMKTKVHPPSIVGADADAYVAKLVAAKVQEGYEVVASDGTQDAVDGSELYLLIPQAQSMEQAPVSDVLVAFGVTPPIPPTTDNRVATGYYLVAGVQVGFERFGTGTNVSAVAGKNQAVLVALFVCLAKVAGVECKVSDATTAVVDARKLVNEAAANGTYDPALTEFLMEFGVVPRPFNVAQLQRERPLRSRFQTAM
jgi:hypothetical protein